MSDPLAAPKDLLLRLLKVPPEPEPPSGSPGSLRCFRAGWNYFRLKRALWAIRQVVVLVAIAAWMIGIHAVLPARLEDGGELTRPQGVDLAGALKWMFAIEVVGLVVAVVQMPFTYALVVLDYEMRWYMATDRSLRIREGLTRVREMTVSFANIQNISLRQGPLQRMLSLHDLVITTAGGGGAGGGGHAGADHHHGESFHTGVLRGVDNAEEIRDLMLARLRALRASGLGDPDEPVDGHADTGNLPVRPDPGHDGTATLAAAREVLGEVRALREGLGGRT